MLVKITCLGRPYNYQFLGEYNNKSALQSELNSIIKYNLVSIQLKDVIKIKLNIKYESYLHNNVLNVICKIHSITYKVGTDYESTMDIVEQDYDTLITNLRWIISKIKNEFYKQQILKETNKINLFRSV